MTSAAISDEDEELIETNPQVDAFVEGDLEVIFLETDDANEQDTLPSITEGQMLLSPQANLMMEEDEELQDNAAATREGQSLHNDSDEDDDEDDDRFAANEQEVLDLLATFDQLLVGGASVDAAMIQQFGIDYNLSLGQAVAVDNNNNNDDTNNDNSGGDVVGRRGLEAAQSSHQPRGNQGPQGGVRPPPPAWLANIVGNVGGFVQRRVLQRLHRFFQRFASAPHRRGLRRGLRRALAFLARQNIGN
uniref:Uncharacterized protein n=1 Tax=Cyclophora tenuis TaxID=216820 RepID=A0A7S1DD52_CYCTE|mmetsp:Transcript_9913/g.16594  ORF Transcript_9913/g.16594 Transcript_9913/m.16594 type:complete len:247 (+) Transcript_9913:272-1012(+)